MGESNEKFNEVVKNWKKEIQTLQNEWDEKIEKIRINVAKARRNGETEGETEGETKGETEGEQPDVALLMENGVTAYGLPPRSSSSTDPIENYFSLTRSRVFPKAKEGGKRKTRRRKRTRKKTRRKRRKKKTKKRRRKKKKKTKRRR